MITLVDTSKQVYVAARAVLARVHLPVRWPERTAEAGEHDHPGQPDPAQHRRRQHQHGQVHAGPGARGSSPATGPNCFGLPDNPQPVVDGKFQIPGEYRCINDGAPLTRDPCAQRRSSSSSESALNAAQSADTTALGSPSENSLVNTLIAGSMHTTPDKVPGIATMLAAPVLPRSGGDGEVRGCVAPLIKLIVFLLVTSSRDLRPGGDDREHQLRRHQQLQGGLHRRVRPQRGRRRPRGRRPRRDGRATSRSSRRAATTARASPRCPSPSPRTARCRSRSTSRCATATWSASATWTSRRAPATPARSSPAPTIPTTPDPSGGRPHRAVPGLQAAVPGPGRRPDQLARHRDHPDAAG